MLQAWGRYYGLYIWEIRITDTVRVRQHKKKRIDKKWLKRYGYKKVEQKNKCYLVKDRFGREVLCCTADVIEKLRKTFEEEEQIHAMNEYIDLRGKAEPMMVKEGLFDGVSMMVFPKKRQKEFGWCLYKKDVPAIPSRLEVIYNVKDE